MGTWISMLIVNLIIPFTLIGFGNHFIKNAPKEVNVVFGYRTKMSMKNQDTWTFAHTYCGKIYRRIGYILIPFAASVMIILLLVIGKEETDIMAIAGGAFALIQIIFLLVPVIPTEKALKKILMIMVFVKIKHFLR